MPVAAGDWLAVGDGDSDGEGDMLPIMCFAPCFAALSATELPPGTLLVFCQSVPKKMHAVTQIHTRMSTPINPTAAFIRGDARVLFSVLIQTRTNIISVANANPDRLGVRPPEAYRRGPMWNVGSFDLQLRLNGRPDLGTKRSYRALPKALDLGLAVGGLGRREKREVEIAPRQRPRDDRIAVRAGTADFWFFGQQDLK
jgi:hypothetical protein